MVKPPKIRHSKSRREPMTIELEPGEVSRIEKSEAGRSAPQAGAGRTGRGSHGETIAAGELRRTQRDAGRPMLDSRR